MTTTYPASTHGSSAQLLLTANTTNNTDTVFGASASAPTAPTGGAVMVPGDGGFLWGMLLGTGSDTNTVAVKVTGFKEVPGGYGPGFLCGHVTGTLSSAVTGATGVTPNGASDYVADVVANTGGQLSVTVENGIADKSAGVFRIDLNGADLIVVQLFDNGSATNANAIVWFGN